MSPEILKQQFRNATDGFVGAVVIGPKGDELGVPVEPGGTVWLSEAEQMLTANAPRRPEDNPFIEQVVIRRNPETDAEEEVKITPLIPVDEGRYVPANERPIPADLHAAPASGAAHAVAAATGDQPETVIAGQVFDNPITREEQIKDAGSDVRPGTLPAPSRAAAAAAAAAQAQAPVEPPEAPSEPEVPAQPPVEEPPLPPAGPPAPSAPTPPAADPARVAPEDEGRAPQAPEETAAVSPGPASEETGAAVTPSGDAPEGHYTAGEEVGTPTAPATAGQQPPAPLPPTEE